jgi:uncharacterized protein with PIN domain
VTPERSLSLALLIVAQDLDRRLYPFAAVIRRAARELAELEAHSTDTDDSRCPSCGGEVIQPPTGRPRRYCSRQCRNRARN